MRSIYWEVLFGVFPQNVLSIRIVLPSFNATSDTCLVHRSTAPLVAPCFIVVYYNNNQRAFHTTVHSTPAPDESDQSRHLIGQEMPRSFYQCNSIILGVILRFEVASGPKSIVFRCLIPNTPSPILTTYSNTTEIILKKEDILTVGQDFTAYCRLRKSDEPQ